LLSQFSLLLFQSHYLITGEEDQEGILQKKILITAQMRLVEGMTVKGLPVKPCTAASAASAVTVGSKIQDKVTVFVRKK
jgi:hypothetical protein